MTEKEFLEDFVNLGLDAWFDESYLIAKIDSFLEQHHKEYYEVEFIKMNETIKDKAKEMLEAQTKAFNTYDILPEEELEMEIKNGKENYT